MTRGSGPEKPGRPVSDHPNKQRALQLKGRPVRTMVVEDDALIALELSCIITERGGSVIARTSVPLEAITLAARLQPDVVLMDVRLFGSMDGIDAARQINRSRRIPIVFVTGNGDARTLGRLAEAGSPVVLKPFTPEQIEAAIITALA